MKKIKYLDLEFYYEIVRKATEFTQSEYTNIYSTTEFELKRKYWIGPKIQKPKFLFKVGINIEDPNYTRESARGHFTVSFRVYVRNEEIKRGYIV